MYVLSIRVRRIRVMDAVSSAPRLRGPRVALLEQHRVLGVVLALQAARQRGHVALVKPAQQIHLQRTSSKT